MSPHHRDAVADAPRWIAQAQRDLARSWDKGDGFSLGEVHLLLAAFRRLECESIPAPIVMPAVTGPQVVWIYGDRIVIGRVVGDRTVWTKDEEGRQVGPSAVDPPPEWLRCALNWVLPRSAEFHPVSAILEDLTEGGRKL